MEIETPMRQEEGEPMEQGYRAPQVCKLVGITYRQLDYWARTDLLKPSM
ncbi:MAG: MerR family transcriptional regulator, partial [Acidimicrobiia bacterium]|nr:MerR family transcriptional regulator [Acidimicrobiia bacterium]